MCRHGEVSLACDAAAATGARRFGARWLTEVVGASPGAQDCIDDTVLVASELVSNAVNAGCAYTLIAIDVHRGRVRVSVEDDGDGYPQVQHPPPTASHGRGLQIIERISVDWGVSPTDTGKQVWADLALPIELTGALDCEL
jgi:anti-sigma regulatory factor (Ser/Thr protein kinase)